MIEERLTTALAPLRESLQADGADLKVTKVSGNELELRIIATDETCIDCLMPEEIIERIVKKKLEDEGASFTQIKLSYPAG
jgi:hypothetical protein